MDNVCQYWVISVIVLLFVACGDDKKASSDAGADGAQHSNTIPKAIKALPIDIPTAYTCCDSSFGDVALGASITGTGNPGKSFLEFGGAVQGPSGSIALPHFTWLVVAGRSVRSPIDGVVCFVMANEGAGANDQELHLSASTESCGDWLVTLDHMDVKDGLVPGSALSANDVIGMTIADNKFEFDIIHDNAHWCPGFFFAESAADDLRLRITTMMGAVEAINMSDTMYDEASMPVPGCKQESLTE